MRNLINRFREYAWLIIAISLLGSTMFYFYANQKAQYYTAKVVIEYDNSAHGKNPDGTDIDTSEIKSAYITGKAIKSLGMTINADAVSNQISIDPIITAEEQALYESKLEHGEDYEIKSDQYVVTLNASTSYGEEYAGKMLGQVIEEYFEYYGEKYVDTIGSVNNLDDISSKGYDYIEMMDVIEESLSSAMDSLSKKASADDTFRSNATGMSFNDLYKEFEFYHSAGSCISSQILNGKITKDKDVLLAKYKKKNSELNLETKMNKKKIKDIKKVIDSYVQMMENSGNSSFVTDDILDSVYDEYKEDSSKDHTTSYDELLQQYVEDRIGCEKNEVEVAYNEYVIDTFSSADTKSSSEQQQEIVGSIDSLLDKINTLYDEYSKTNNDYNRYLGAQHLKPLSSISIQKKIPVKKYVVLLAAALLLFGFIALCVVSRLIDIFQEIMYTPGKEESHEKDESLSNRTK